MNSDTISFFLDLSHTSLSDRLSYCPEILPMINGGSTINKGRWPTKPARTIYLVLKIIYFSTELTHKYYKIHKSWNAFICNLGEQINRKKHRCLLELQKGINCTLIPQRDLKNGCICVYLSICLSIYFLGWIIKENIALKLLKSETCLLYFWVKCLFTSIKPKKLVSLHLSPRTSFFSYFLFYIEICTF